MNNKECFQSETEQINKNSPQVEEIVSEQKLITRRRFGTLFAGLVATATLNGCNQPDIDALIREKDNGKIMVDPSIKSDNKIEDNQPKKTPLKPAKPSKTTCSGKCTIVKPKNKEDITPLQKRLLEEHKDSFFDKYTGNVIIKWRKPDIIEEPMVKFDALFATSKKVNGKNKVVYETDIAIMKKSVAEAFLRAEKKYGKRIILVRTFATNKTQNFFYERKIRENRKYSVGKAGTSAHEIGQAIDIYNRKEARNYLLAEGFLDLECADAPHFEYHRNKRFSKADKKCSIHNKRYYYGGRKMRKIGKVVNKGRKILRKLFGR